MTNAHLRALGICSIVALGCQLAALSLPSPSGPADRTLVAEMTLVTAIVSVTFGLIIGYIAWDAREWAPTLLALGCLSMASGAVVRFITADPGLGLEPSVGAGFAPVLGMLLGGVWFALAVQTWWPASGVRDAKQTVAARTVLVAGVLGVAGACYACAAFPALVPGEQASRVAAGLAAAGYIFAAVRFFAVWRFLRLPSQFATMLGALSFAPLVMVLAAGGVPHIAPYQLESLIIFAAALPAGGFLLEQARRPGLRTMVFGLFVPGAVLSMRRGYPKVMTGLVERIASYDQNLRGHVDRVADLSTRIATQLKVDGGCAREVMLAGQLHDIGKLFVPRGLLQKQGRLSELEMTSVRTHAASGAQLVARIPEIAVVARGVGEHHERWDGAGYPRGLKGVEITEAARIVAVADVYDALRSARSYKSVWGVAEAVSEIERGSGTQFEPRVVQALVRLVADGAGRRAA